MSQSRLFKNGLAFGHIIECFDNTLYGFFSVLLAPIFFPSTDPLTQVLSSFGAFAAGFLTKPLGAIIFGILGDSTNRNTPLVFSIGLVGIPTLIIGLLPSYQDVGILAPIVLILSESMALNGLTMIFNALFLIPCGRISDSIGFSNMIQKGCLANILVAFPAFALLTGSSVGFLQVVLFLLMMMASGTLINGCAFPYMASFFPASVRYTGLAVSYTFGTALLSGTSPVIATFLTNYYGSGIAVSWYIILTSVITLVLHRLLILKRLERTTISTMRLKGQAI